MTIQKPILRMNSVVYLRIQSWLGMWKSFYNFIEFLYGFKLYLYILDGVFLKGLNKIIFQIVEKISKKGACAQYLCHF